MKKISMRYTSLVLVVVLLFTCTVPVLAASTPEHIAFTTETIDGVLKITEEIRDNETIIRQYCDEQLVETVHIPVTSDTDDTVILTIESSTSNVANQPNIRHVEVTKAPKSTQNDIALLADIYLGKINYSTSDGKKTITVKYDTTVLHSSTVTLHSGLSTVASLAGILVSYIGIKVTAATAVVKWLLGIMGIATTATSFFFPGRTLSCRETDYTYTLTDSTYGLTNQLLSASYYITDEKDENASYKGTTEVDGWTPSTAQDDITFAQACYALLYEGSYSVIGWS